MSAGLEGPGWLRVRRKMISGGEYGTVCGMGVYGQGGSFSPRAQRSVYSAGSTYKLREYPMAAALTLHSITLTPPALPLTVWATVWRTPSPGPSRTPQCWAQKGSFLRTGQGLRRRGHSPSGWVNSRKVGSETTVWEMVCAGSSAQAMSRGRQDLMQRTVSVLPWRSLQV